MGRTKISKGALLVVSAQRGESTCGLNDIINLGSGVRLYGIQFHRPFLNCYSIISIPF
jgi:hypothetical protein